jgi:hypothetical protein
VEDAQLNKAISIGAKRRNDINRPATELAEAVWLLQPY